MVLRIRRLLAALRSEVKTPLYHQYAALPWRMQDGALEVLLITTLTTHRWIVPKGWPMDGKAPSETAAQEALEEAGIAGAIDAHPLGSYTYKKLRKSGEVVTCKVDVFPLEVKTQKRSWAEKATRECNWLPVQEAMTRVQEPGLRRLLLKFANTHRDPARAVASVSRPSRRAATRR